MPLGPGQPPAFLEALGRRTDWEDLRIGGALLTVLTDLFSHPNVHYLSGFYGPLERMLRDARRQHRLRAGRLPALQPDPRGGAAPGDVHGRRPARRRRLVQPLAPRRGHGRPAPRGRRRPRPARSSSRSATSSRARSAPATTATRCTSTRSTCSSRATGRRSPPRTRGPTDVDRAIAEHVRAFVPDGATLQTGIGAVPSTVATLLAEGDGGGYGIHSEMFTTGLMRLHQAGKVANRKALFDGVSVATFAAGTRELYDWLHENHEVAFLPVDLVNSPELIAPQPRPWSRSTPRWPSTSRAR